MKTKKSGVFAALAVVLLLSAVLITNCVDPITGSGGLNVSQGKYADFQPPPGKGLIFLSFEAPESTNGRTIRPNTSTYTDATKFTFFDVYWIDNDHDPEEEDEDAPGYEDHGSHQYNIAAASIATTPLALTSGRAFEIQVFAYTSGTSTNKAQAIAFGAFTITPDGTAQTANIDLKEIITNESFTVGTGTFSWVLTNNGDNAATTATMDILGLPGGTSVLTDATPINLIGGLENTHTLAPGYYRVEITLGKAGAATTKIREILHIYQGMTSTYNYALPSVNPDVYTITYTFNDGRTTDPTENVSVKHGNDLAGPATNPPVHNGNSSIWQFEGWWTSASGEGTQRITVDEAGDPTPVAYKPIKSETLFARWQGTGVTLKITVNYDDEESPQLTLSGFTDWAWDSDTNTGTASASRNHPPTNVTLSVSNSTDYTANGYTWNHGSSTYLDTQTTSSVTLDFTNINLQLVGTHVIDVTATATTANGGGYYSSHITITITDAE